MNEQEAAQFTEQHTQFVNASDLEFKCIDSEEYRTYSFAHPTLADRFVDVTLDRPLLIHVSESGGHRVFCDDGRMYYVPSGWVLLEWAPKEGQATVNF